MRSDLHAIALEIFQFCANNGIELELQWIPGNEIERADYISRIIDIDDWQVSAHCFISFEESWGVHSVACFARYYNKKVCKCFSRFWNPAFSGRIASLFLLLIARAIHYLHVSRAIPTALVPF